MSQIGVNEKRFKYHFIELLRFIMCIWVMSEHLWVAFPGQGDINVNFGHLAIYAFMMISGFFSAERPNRTRAIHSLILMFISYILIYLIVLIAYSANSNLQNNINLKRFLDFNSFDNLLGTWYFISFYVVICLFSPLLVNFVKNFNKWFVLGFLLFICSISAFYQLVDTFIFKAQLIGIWSENRELFFVISFLFGCWIKFYVKIDSKKMFIICLIILPIVFGIGIFRVVIEKEIKNEAISGFIDRFFNVKNPICNLGKIAISFCLIIVFLNFRINKAWFKYICLYLGQISMTVFLFHQTFFSILTTPDVMWHSIDSFWKVVVIYIIAISICAVITPFLNLATNKLFAFSLKKSNTLSNQNK